MTLILQILIGCMWRLDHSLYGLGAGMVLPLQIILGLLSMLAGTVAVWRLGGRDIQSAINSLILVCVLAAPALLLAGEQMLLVWALALPVCSSAMLVGNAPDSVGRWQARGLWLISAAALSLLILAGASTTIVVSLFSWTVGWAFRRLPIRQKEWLPQMDNLGSKQPVAGATSKAAKTV